jgi:hypothetical protein
MTYAIRPQPASQRGDSLDALGNFIQHLPPAFRATELFYHATRLYLRAALSRAPLDFTPPPEPEI